MFNLKTLGHIIAQEIVSIDENYEVRAIIGCDNKLQFIALELRYKTR